jgi:2-amino-4-hydroxy-6-hydroxymethyldihydropteridine diphosphokinase
VQNEDTKKTLVLALGSNLGNRYFSLYTACKLLANYFDSVVTLSNIYESEPWGNTNQPAFLNTVVTLKTADTPHQCLKKTQAIEQQMGRRKTVHWGPRNIDIDILFLEDEVFTSEHLTVPHPQIKNRNFVYVQLLDLEVPLPPSIQIPEGSDNLKGLSLFAHSLNHQINF